MDMDNATEDWLDESTAYDRDELLPAREPRKDKPSFRSRCSACQKIIEPGEPMKHLHRHGWLHSWCADSTKSRKLSARIKAKKRPSFWEQFDACEAYGFGGDEDW